MYQGPSRDCDMPPGEASSRAPGRPLAASQVEHGQPDRTEGERVRDAAIAAIVDASPPLSDAQRARLTVLLEPGQSHTDLDHK